MRVAGPPSWRISEDRWPEAFDVALWFRAADRIDVASEGGVPGHQMLSRCRTRVRTRRTPPSWPRAGWPGGIRWSGCPLSPPFDPAHPPALLAFSPPDFPSLAAWPALRRAVTGRWRRAYDWHNARKKAGLEAGLHHNRRTGQVVAELERELGRKARPFSLDFVLLPVRDEQVRPAGTDRYLVPERVYDGPRWPRLLRGLLIPHA